MTPRIAHVRRDVGNYLAGLTDGEGCFYVTAARAKGNYACGFVIKLRADDRAVLEWLCEEIGVGYVRTESRPNGKPQLRWEVQRKRDCMVIRELFERFPLRSKKARDYEVWAKAVDHWVYFVHNGPGTNTDWTPLIEAKERLAELRLYEELAPA